MPEAFASRPAPRLIFGPGKLRELPEAVRGLGGTAVFVVSDPGVARAGHLDAALRVSDLMCRSLTRLRHAIVAPDALMGPVPCQGPKVVSLVGAMERRNAQRAHLHTQTPGTGL